MSKRSQLLEEIFSTMTVSKRVMHAHFQRILEKSELSPSQMHLLDTIARHSSVTSKSLADEMRLTPGAITQLVDGLDKAGYIERRQDEQDRRVTNLSISDAAKQKMSEFKKIHHQTLRKALTSLDDHELETFLQIQKKMLAYFEAQNKQSKEAKEKER